MQATVDTKSEVGHGSILTPWSGYWQGYTVLFQPGEDVLAEAYLRFKQEQVLDYIFYSGVPSLSWFLDTYGKKIPVLQAMYRGQAIGLGWLNEQTDVLAGKKSWLKAECGMAFYRKVPENQTRWATWLMMDWCFRSRDIDVLYGTTPAPNRAAVRHIRNLGFDLHGPIPGYCSWHGSPVGCWISSMTKENWETKGIFSKRPPAKAGGF